MRNKQKARESLRVKHFFNLVPPLFTPHERRKQRNSFLTCEINKIIYVTRLFHEHIVPPFDYTAFAVSLKVSNPKTNSTTLVRSLFKMTVLSRSAIVVKTEFLLAFFVLSIGFFFNFCWYRGFCHRTVSHQWDGCVLSCISVI